MKIGAVQGETGRIQDERKVGTNGEKLERETGCDSV